MMRRAVRSSRGRLVGPARRSRDLQFQRRTSHLLARTKETNGRQRFLTPSRRAGTAEADTVQSTKTYPAMPGALAVTTLSFDPIEVPLRLDEQGAIRFGQTRVLLDVVLHEFDSGATPEEIVDCYEGLDLADVYAVLGYCLRNRPALNDYLRRRQAEADTLRQTIEASQPWRPNLRARLQARQRAKRDGNGSPPQ